MSDKKQEPVNKKLLLFCGILLAIGFVYMAMPTKGVVPPNSENTNQTNTIKPSTNNKVPNNNSNNVVIEKPQIKKLPDYKNVNNSDLNILKGKEDYMLSLNQMLTAKDNGVYSTYRDKSTSNPYIQQYPYSKESDAKPDITEYPNAFYGSVANGDDYTVSFPNGDQKPSVEQTNESGKEKIYWRELEGAHYYHKDKNCPNLGGHEPKEGTLEDAKKVGKDNPCPDCARN